MPGTEPERTWSEPIGELSMQWAHEIAKQITDWYAVSIRRYTTLELPSDRHGAMIEYHEFRDGETAQSGSVKILTHVNVCVRWDGAREISVQVYSGHGQGTGGLSRRWLAPADDPQDNEIYVMPLLEAIGVWAFSKRLEVARQVS